MTDNKVEIYIFIINNIRNFAFNLAEAYEYGYGRNWKQNKEEESYGTQIYNS